MVSYFKAKKNRFLGKLQEIGTFLAGAERFELSTRGFGGTVGAGSATQGLPVLRGFVGLGSASSKGLMLF